MNYYWKPETKKEKAEHLRMKKEWEQVRKMSGEASRRKHRSHSKFRFLFVITVFIFLFLVSKCNINKPVSKSVHLYLSQDKIVSQQYSFVMESISKDQKSDSLINCNKHMDSINNLLNEIEVLFSCSISPFSPMKDYEQVCEAYWTVVYEFFSSIKNSRNIAVDEYNLFVSKLSASNLRWNRLLELLTDNGYYCSVKGSSIYYKYRDGIVNNNLKRT